MKLMFPLGVVVLMILAAVGGMLLASERRAAARSGSAATAETTASSDRGLVPAAPAGDSSAAMPDVSTDLAAVSPTAPRGVLEDVTWVTESTHTLRELGRAWGIPRATLTKLNPSLSGLEQIPAGTRVAIYARSSGADFSVGAPNAGRLVRGVPMPDGPAWELARGRARAYGTADTIDNLTAALTAYARRFPGTAPVEIGDISAQRGGKVTSHNSHQSGRDADIMLVAASNDSGRDSEPQFAPDRNWFLVKTLIDRGSVQTIFLNASQQRWLKEAAVADVGAERAAEYFERVRHERGHTYHLHVRFACPEDHRRCVNHPQA